jgi:diaminopimelate decarboxylase
MTSSIIHKKNDDFYIENTKLKDVVAKHKTPLYVYSKKQILNQISDFSSSLDGLNSLICFAVKANSNIAILNLMAEKSLGFDIVSGGELKRVIAAKGDPKKVVFSGIGKSHDEIQLAIKEGILSFNIESQEELLKIQSIAQKLEKKAPISIRVNPNVDAKTHPYISTGLKDNKFGVAENEAIELYKLAKELSHIQIKGVDCHIGSQITEIAPFTDSLNKLIHIYDQLKSLGIELEHIDIGGGIGIDYMDDNPPSFSDYAKAIKEVLGNRKIQIIFEPGRVIVGKAGILLTKIEYLKSGETKNFAIVDAAMNDLMRPSLYDAYHKIINLSPNNNINEETYDVVGPVCETGDFLGKQRKLSIQTGDLLAVFDVGAYGMSMSSNYNSRPRACEVIVDDEQFYEIKSRETFDQLIANEKLIQQK